MTKSEPEAWHREVIPAETETTLRALREAKLLSPFYLAGGTGLALQFGHRLSLDLDFFSPEQFDEETLLQHAQALPEFALVSRAPFTLHATVGGTKVSFLGYVYPLLFPTRRFEDVAVADSRDIACMKVSAIASRGTRRDFVDLYVASQQYGLQEILQLFAQKYAQTRYSKMHVLKSLTYFGDAEKDPLPHMLVPFDWEKTRQFFEREVPRLL